LKLWNSTKESEFKKAFLRHSAFKQAVWNEEEDHRGGLFLANDTLYLVTSYTAPEYDDENVNIDDLPFFDIGDFQISDIQGCEDASE
jgi:hypothetical protein